jgi:Aspartyl protease
MKFPSPFPGGVRGGGATPSTVIGRSQCCSEIGIRGADTPIPNPFPARGKGLVVRACRVPRPPVHARAKRLSPFALTFALILAAPAHATDIPATFSGGLIFVRVAIGGGPPGTFLLDTGAGTTILDARFAGAAGVKLGDPIALVGGGGATGGRRAENVRLTLAGGEVDAMTDPTVADLGRIDQGMRTHLDGILGDDVLRRFVVTLDYREGTVRLDPPNSVAGAASPPPDAVRMGGLILPFVTAQVRQGGRSADADFQIDTGSNTAIELWAPFARQAFPDARVTPGAGMGVGGMTQTERGRLDALTVAGHTIAGPTANFADRTAPDDAGPAYGGVIGGPAWRGLVLTLDFPHRRVWLR